MIVPGETFPYLPLSDCSYDIIVTACGGKPVTDADSFNTFLNFSARPLVAGSMFPQFLEGMARISSESLDLDIDTAAAESAFLLGAYFYVGVVRVETQADRFPYTSDVLGEIDTHVGRDFALESYAAIRQQVPSFCALVEEVAPAMKIAGNEQLGQMALIGAGSLHILGTRTVDQMPQNSAYKLTAAHPELDDLRQYGL